MGDKPEIGAIEWFDLTVPDAKGIQQFYSDVVGWTATEHPMEGYSDFNIQRPGHEDAIAGICHARGSNSKIPSQWLLYVRVANVEKSAAVCREKGGQVLDGPRPMGPIQFCVIQDPAGAVMAIISGDE